MTWLLNLDANIFLAFHSVLGKWYALDLFGILCAKYLIFIIAGIVIGWWLSLHEIRFPKRVKITESWLVESKKKWQIFWHVILAFITGYGINFLIGLIKFRPRPFTSLGVQNIVNPLSAKSFPSDHTMTVFVASMCVYFYNKKLGLILLGLSLLVGLGRIFVGVHYPLDVVGGIIVGLFTATIFYLILNRKIKDTGIKV